MHGKLDPRHVAGDSPAQFGPHGRIDEELQAVNPGEDVNVSVRRIDNGYLVRTSRWTGETFQEKEVFSKTDPRVSVTKGSDQ